MEGVIVLDTFETVIGHNPGFNFGAGTCFLCALACFITCLILVSDCRSGDNFFGFLTTAFFAVGMICFMLNSPVYETRQEVYIEPTVNFAEFQQRYEIVGQDGVVYIVRDLLDEVPDVGDSTGN